MKLHEWHDAFAGLIQKNDQTLMAFIAADDRLGNKQGFQNQTRLDVYRNNSRQATIGALSQTYELCTQCVGDDYFSQLASDYLAHHPVQHVSLNDYGALFPEHLENLLQRRSEMKSLGYLPDLARLDWVRYHSYYAENRCTWAASEFNQLSAEEQANTRLQLSPDCYLLASHWPLFEIWELLKGEREQAAADWSEQKNYLLIKRDEYQVQLLVLEESIYKALKAVKEGSVLSQLATDHADVMAYLPEWIGNGWIDRFTLGTL
jgi:hypothetical protein